MRRDGGTPEDVLRRADVVCTCTSAREPILERRWLEPGAHVNAVGSSVPSARELDAATMADATLFVDRRESALSEAGDLLLAGFGEERIAAERARSSPDASWGARTRGADRVQVARARRRGPRGGQLVVRKRRSRAPARRSSS